MTWELRYRLRLTARTSLVPWAVTALAAALAVSPAVRELDAATGWRVFGFTPTGRGPRSGRWPARCSRSSCSCCRRC